VIVYNHFRIINSLLREIIMGAEGEKSTQTSLKRRTVGRDVNGRHLTAGSSKTTGIYSLQILQGG
jgi:hypothetical protein